MTKSMRKIHVWMAGTALAILPATAMAQAPVAPQNRTQQTYRFDLPAQNLADALRIVASRAGLELYVPSDAVSGMTGPELHATMSVQDAAVRLLDGTSLTAKVTDGAVLIRGRSTSSQTSVPPPSAPEILVTGSHIRGAPIAAPVTVIHREEIEQAGQNDMGEVVRSLPMNFNGGQNPGAAFQGWARMAMSALLPASICVVWARMPR
jgi:hypothetical protein